MAFENQIKHYLLFAVKNFNLDINNLPNLLDTSSQIVNAILNEQPCTLTKEENELLFHRAFFLAEGLLACTPQERMKVIIETDLIGNCKLSPESLAKYANVPLEVFNTFLTTDQEIESKYLANIYFNLSMLFRILYTDNKSNRK